MRRVLAAVAGALAVSGMRTGVGIADCTCPATEYLFMGMANPKQRGDGLWTRQYARAFVFVGESAADRLAFVSVDSAMVGHVLKKRVLEAVGAALGDNGTYTYSNVILSGTHTHSGSSGYMQHMIFQLAGSGWIPQTIDALVDLSLIHISEPTRPY